MARVTAKMMDKAADALRRLGWDVRADFDMDDLAEDASWAVDPHCTMSFSERARLANGVALRLLTRT